MFTQSILDLNPSQTDSQILDASILLADYFYSDRPISKRNLAQAMNEAFGGTDANNCWNWKWAWEALEVAQILFLRRFSLTSLTLEFVETILKLCPTHSIRNAEMDEFQQFSTPITLGYLIAIAAGFTPSDRLLESSAGTGLLAFWGSSIVQALCLNEIAPLRQQLLKQLFPKAQHLGVNGEYIDAYLPESFLPTIAILNPPFSASPNFTRNNSKITGFHLTAAFKALAFQGRMIAVTGSKFPSFALADSLNKANYPTSLKAIVQLPPHAYTPHGTSFPVAISIWDKVASSAEPTVYTVEHLANALPIMQAIAADRPHLTAIASRKTGVLTLPSPQIQGRTAQNSGSKIIPITGNPSEIQYQPVIHPSSSLSSSDASIYEPYAMRVVDFVGAKPHPTPLVESIAMAAVSYPMPTYRPVLPHSLIERGLLSDAQLEAVTLAGQAHQSLIEGDYALDKLGEIIRIESDDATELTPVRYRYGWACGDGTGVGKGRIAAAILLDNWNQGRNKAIWVSRSQSLLKDAQRDFLALGGDPSNIVPLSKFKQGEPISLTQGILFLTYATLRSGAKINKVSRIDQIIAWLGLDFAGAILFDESHALGNAVASEEEMGTKEASQQGRAGLELQRRLPLGRVVYISATGATELHNLAYMERLGLWLGDRTPFTTRDSFFQKLEKAGVAGLEVISRDLKSMGLYLSRSISFEEVEYALVEHPLTAHQVSTYDTYAEIFQAILNDIDKALEATKVTEGGKTYNKNAKRAALSTFWGKCQRFFLSLIASFKVPTLFAKIDKALANQESVVIQVTNTDEALLNRQLADTLPEDWPDLQIDLSSKDLLLGYLNHAFPVLAQEVYTNESNEVVSRPLKDSHGNFVLDPAAIALRDQLIERVSLLPPIPSALDSILWRYGAEQVAEVTGRSKRTLMQAGKLVLDKRGGRANQEEIAAFQGDLKQILIFSEAGSTGESYHAGLDAINQRKRNHIALQLGWQAKIAIQGLGRSHRSNQKQPPRYLLLSTNIAGEKRFTSTIARRLDNLGAITKGQRQTGSQNLYQETDNLESRYARKGLELFINQLKEGKITTCGFDQFIAWTHLKVTPEAPVPKIQQFLNRIMALPFERQNALFEEFDRLHQAVIENAKESGTYEVGVETLRALRFQEIDRTVLFESEGGSQTVARKIQRCDPTRKLSFPQVQNLLAKRQGWFAQNGISGNIAAITPTTLSIDEQGNTYERLKITAPDGSTRTLKTADYQNSSWGQLSTAQAEFLWEDAISQIPDETYSEFYLISGLLLPIWDKLEIEGNFKVYRLSLASGESILGRLVDAQHFNLIYQRFKPTSESLTCEEIYHQIVEQRIAFPLWDNTFLRLSHVGGSDRLEVTSVYDSDLIHRLQQLGCFTERINWQTRVFLPIEAKQSIPIIESLMV